MPSLDSPHPQRSGLAWVAGTGAALSLLLMTFPPVVGHEIRRGERVFAEAPYDRVFIASDLQPPPDWAFAAIDWTRATNDFLLFVGLWLVAVLLYPRFARHLSRPTATTVGALCVAAGALFWFAGGAPRSDAQIDMQVEALIEPLLGDHVDSAEAQIRLVRIGERGRAQIELLLWLFESELDELEMDYYASTTSVTRHRRAVHNVREALRRIDTE